jgi:hypothetical protein
VAAGNDGGPLNQGMGVRRLHRLIGIVMLLPLFGWAATGLIFFLKPGYEGAYDLPQIKTYPMEEQISIPPDSAWLEARYLKTVLGTHLIVRNTQGWKQLDPRTLEARKKPTADEIRTLMTDAFSKNAARYGEIKEINGETAVTNTGVRVTLNWDRMSLQQRGKDTDLIDGLYKVHYLQWTGVKWMDMALGIVGLALITMLSLLGLLLSFNMKLIKKA